MVYLGDRQRHLAVSYTPDRWGQEWVANAPEGEPPDTLRLAAELFQTGLRRGERRAFVNELAEAGGLRHAEVRRLALELRGTERVRRGHRHG